LVKEEVRSGLLLILNLPPDDFDEKGYLIEMNDEEQKSVPDTVAVLMADAKTKGIGKLDIDIFGLNTSCKSRRLRVNGGASHSLHCLPYLTSAVEFCMVITEAIQNQSQETLESLQTNQ
jgi:hypothetical protein